jgi:hypothetical protein
MDYVTGLLGRREVRRFIYGAEEYIRHNVLIPIWPEGHTHQIKEAVLYPKRLIKSP